MTFSLNVFLPGKDNLLQNEPRAIFSDGFVKKSVILKNMHTDEYRIKLYGGDKPTKPDCMVIFLESGDHRILLAAQYKRDRVFMYDLYFKLCHQNMSRNFINAYNSGSKPLPPLSFNSKNLTQKVLCDDRPLFYNPEGDCYQEFNDYGCTIVTSALLGYTHSLYHLTPANENFRRKK